MDLLARQECVVCQVPMDKRGPMVSRDNLVNQGSLEAQEKEVSFRNE